MSKIRTFLEPFRGKKRFVVIYTVSALLLSILLLPYRWNVAKHLKVGDVSPVTIRAPKSIKFEDVKRTQLLRESVVGKVKPVYISNIKWVHETYDRLSELFTEIRNLKDLDQAYVVFERKLNFAPSKKTIKEIISNGRYIETLLGRLLARYEKLLVLDRLPKRPPVGFSVYDTTIDRFYDVDSWSFVYTFDQKDQIVKMIIDEEVPLSEKSLKQALFEILSHIVKPTLIYDEKLTEKRIEEELKKIKPVIVSVRKGEVIVAEGETVTEDIYIKLKELDKAVEESSYIKSILSLFIILIIILSLCGILLSKVYSGRLDPFHSHMLLNFIIVSSVVFLRFFIYFYDKSLGSVYQLDRIFLAASSPVMYPGVISSFTVGFPASLVIIIGVTATSAFIPSASFYLPVFVISSSLAAIYGMRRGKVPISLSDAKIIDGALYGMISLFFVTLGLCIYRNIDMKVFFVFPIISGLVTTFLVYALIPLIEYVFDVVTDFRLLKLTTLDHPLLKELLEKAQGTYNHSMQVGMLAEAAALEVGANPILAKVGGYFHDVGKLKNPKYFVENTGISMHEKLSPSMSRLIVISHVKDGVELALKYKLPKCVVEIIEQHHGTSLISYFYHKAKQMAKEKVEEEIYRYPGPKPKSKEAAIVMIADSCEAAVRSLDELTPAKIKSTVESVINRIFMDGQLDECDLTLKDIKKLNILFLKMLTSLFHRRVKYPEENGNNSNR